MALIRPVQSVVEQRRQQRHTQVLRYPEDLGSHAIILNFKKYDYSSTGTGVNRKNGNSIVLPLPTNLKDTFSVNSKNQELGLGGAAVVDFIQRGRSGDIRSTGADAADKLGAALDKVSSGNFQFDDALSSFKGAAQFFGRAGLDSTVPGVGAAIDVASGKAINPHVTVDFDGMNLKEHSFTWTFGPKNDRDSTRLNNVIGMIRRASLPQYDSIGGLGSRSLINYPDLVDIFFVGIDQSYFYHFKPCMINNFTTDFTPNGPAFVAGGRPATVQMTMNLTEAEIHTREDYLSDEFMDNKPGGPR